MNPSHHAAPASRSEWGPIDVPVYCDSCGKGTEHRWADFAAEQIECRQCGQRRPIEHVEGDPAL